MSELTVGRIVFTPGPWKVRCGVSGVFNWDIVGPKGEDIAYENSTDGADEPTTYPVEANARLLAAAPELLAELRTMTDSFERCIIASGSDPEFAAIRVSRARALIAKAEGR